MLETKLKNHIIKIYKDIEEISSVQEVTEGYLSQNTILQSKKRKFFLKQYRNTYTEDDVSDIDRVSLFFSHKNIPIILPLINNQDKGYFTLNNRIYSLFPFVNGVKVDRKNIDKKSIKTLAQTLANIHLLSINGPPIKISAQQGDIDSTRFLKDYPKILEILNSIKDKGGFDNLALELLSLKHSIVERNIGKIKRLKIKRDHLLHGDYHEKNVFLDKNKNVKYIFDLEKTEMGDRLHEVVRSMDFICLNEAYDDSGIKKACLYIRSYNKLYPILKKDFLNALENYYFKKANSLWIERTHYLEKSDRVDCFLKNQLASLKFLPKNYERLAKFIEV